MNLWLVAALPFVLVLMAGYAAEAVPAFPGAEGFGAGTPGGRGGKVLFVRNLNDSGPGSFREACETKGPRIIVFRVAGIVDLKKAIRISEPYVTIGGNPRPATASASAGARSAFVRTT